MSAERVTNGEGERESEATRAEVMTDEESGKAVWRNPLVRKVAVSAAALLVAFLLGLIPMWLVARDRAHVALAWGSQRGEVLERLAAARGTTPRPAPARAGGDP